MAKQLRFLFWLFKFSFLLSAILIPLVVAFGLVNKWSPATEALASYSGQIPIMVGFSYSFKESSSGSTRDVERSHALWPSLLQEPKVITIRQVNDLTPVVSKSRYGFIYSAGWYVISILGTWWFWLRRTKQEPPNKMLKPIARKRAPV